MTNPKASARRLRRLVQNMSPKRRRRDKSVCERGYRCADITPKPVLPAEVLISEQLESMTVAEPGTEPELSDEEKLELDHWLAYRQEQELIADQLRIARARARALAAA